MSATSKSSASKGVRYTDAQKKEVLDFVASYNAANGRGGQSKAAEKFNISALTIAAWGKGGKTPADKPAKAVKAAKASKAPKAPKVPKAPKAAKPAKKSGKTGTRYTDEQKQEIVDFALAYNAANGRGGQSKAAAKFKVSPLTIMGWLKAGGAKKVSKKSAAKAPKAAKASKPAKAAKASSGGDFDSKLAALLALRKEISKAEGELAKLNAKFDSLKASL